MSDDSIFLTVKSVSKRFMTKGTQIPVLRDVSFAAKRGEWTMLLGASGSGKTTLLDIIGTISHPTTGEVIIDGVNPAHLSGSELVDFRRKNIGFVFQSYHILPELNVLENVMLPALLDGLPRAVCKKVALELLEQVGLSDRVEHRVNALSGGEQQRAAIARAMINEPFLLLADEPTGNLDSQTGKGILSLFHDLVKCQGATILMVTHDTTITNYADRVIVLKDGVIAG